jgi:hypothetical protein
MNIFALIGKIFKPAAELIDNLHTSDEERLIQKAKMLDIQAQVMSAALAYENTQLKIRQDTINNEIKSEHWITATWRPLTMLAFVVAIMGYWFGLVEVPAEAVDGMFTLVQIGIGGYTLGRSAEKIVPAVVKSMKSKEEV